MTKSIPLFLVSVLLFAGCVEPYSTASLKVGNVDRGLNPKSRKDNNRIDGKVVVSVTENGPWIGRSSELDDFQTTIRPLLVKYCADCHSPGDMEGLEFLVEMTDADLANHRGLFAGVVEQMDSRAMPPRGSDQPTEEERRLVTDWLKKTLDLKPSDTDRISQYVVEAYEDKAGNLWFGTMNDGAARYDGSRLTYFSVEHGLASNAVPSFAEDKDGNLWVGTQAGICKFDGKAFVRQGPAQGLPAASRPSAMASGGVNSDQQGNIWASVGTKVYRLDGTTFKEFKTPIVREKIKSFSIVPGQVSFKLEDKAGNLWFGTDGDGAYRFDGTSFTHFTKEDGLCSNTVNSIMQDKQGNIWFACMQSYQPKMTGDGGLCRYDGKTFTKFPHVKGLCNNDLYTIHETRSGDIWIGATGVGAYRYDGKTFTLFNETDKPHWTRHFGVQSILEDRHGTLWFGFSGGLFRFDGESFFNVKKKGPWKDLVSTMAEAIAGKKVNLDWLHAETQSALNLLAKGEFKKAKTIFKKLLAESPNEMTVAEETINRVGYELIWSKNPDLALEVFRLNTELHPTAFNTFDSLAEAYWRMGNEQLAVEYFEKSLELNAENGNAKDSIRQIAARQKYESLLPVPDGWLEEVLIVPPSFAPEMSLTGMEHLRLPPEFRDPESDWFISYLFAIELTETSDLTEEFIGEQLLEYFRGLASGGSNENGVRIDTKAFSIEKRKLDGGTADGEHIYLLNWQEPFANATHLQQNIRVKVITKGNEHGIVFICGSPQPFDSDVWTELLKVRSDFEATLSKEQKEQ